MPQTATKSSTTPNAVGTTIAKAPHAQSHRDERIESLPVVASSTKAREDEPEVHVVFSTDCSGYQHWQSIALWYSSRQAGHRGAVTRIASGCDDEDKLRIDTEWRKIDRTGDFRAHHAPKGELKGNYKYSNKPSGLYHWLRFANPAPFKDKSRGIVALLDPDQLLLRPITAAFASGLTENGGKSLVDLDGRPRVLTNGPREARSIPSFVGKGSPVAQEYGIGGAWGNAGKDNARPSWKTFDRARVCGEGGACTQTSASEADSHYSVGPPYLLQAEDALDVAQAWQQAVPHVHAQYPFLLAEMYAYSMAAANLSLPHAQIHNLMVSNVDAGGEGWDWIDDSYDSVCAGATQTTPPFDTRRPRDVRFTNREHAPGPAAPTVLHFCQSYKLAGHKFGKHSIPHDLFSCENEEKLLDFDPRAIADAVLAAKEEGKQKGTKALRNAYFLCNVIPRINAAILEYRRTVCDNMLILP